MPSLDWIGKQAVNKHYKELPYNLLKVDKDLSVNIESSNGNMLVHGDNLVALKSLLPYYSQKVKFAYLDVPYNTGNENWIYNDNVSDPQIRDWLGKVVGKEFEDLSRHDKWLCMMYPRLQLVKEFLDEDGFICVQIDEAEGASLKLLMDEIFLASNYLTTLYVQVRYAEKTLKRDMNFHKEIEQILVYRKSPKSSPNLPEVDYNYDKFNFSVKEKGKGKEIELGGKKVIIFESNEYEIVKHKEGFREGLKEIWATGTILDGNSSGRFFRDYFSNRKEIDGLGVVYKVYGIGDDMYDYRYFTGPKRANATKGKYYQGVPNDKLEELGTDTVPIPNYYDMAADFGNCRHEGGVEFNSGKKPEKLLSMLIKYFSKPGDYILDSFAGSGTTPAVSQKMGRKWIAIEMGDHCYTHTHKRLKSVIKGEDTTGVTDKYNWNGGSGFQFCEFDVALTDEYGIINKEVSYKDLARHIYFIETGRGIENEDAINSPYIGGYSNVHYFLLFNNNESINILNIEFLETINKYDGMKVIYTDVCTVSDNILSMNGIIFKQIPYQIEVK